MNEAMYYLEMAEIAVDKADLMLESFEAYSELESRSDEIRAYVEDGFDDVYDEAAETAAVEKKKSLLTRAYDAIIHLLSTIKQTVFGMISKIKGEDKVVVMPAKYVDKNNLNLLDKLMAKFRSFTSTTSGKVVTAIAAIVAAVLAAFGVYKGGKKIMMTVKEAKAASKTYEKHTSFLHDFAEKLKNDHIAHVNAAYAKKKAKYYEKSLANLDTKIAAKHDKAKEVAGEISAAFSGMKDNVEKATSVLDGAGKAFATATANAKDVVNEGSYDVATPEAIKVVTRNKPKSMQQRAAAGGRNVGNVPAKGKNLIINDGGGGYVVLTTPEQKQAALHAKTLQKNAKKKQANTLAGISNQIRDLDRAESTDVDGYNIMDEGPSVWVPRSMYGTM